MGNYNRSNLKSFFICLMTILTILPLQAQDISKDLVLALTFDEGGGQAVADKSGQGNDAKIDGKMGWVDGKIGGGFQFDGKTWVIAPHIPFNERDFTVQFWVKSELISDQEVIFSQYEKNGKNLSLHLRLYNTGKVRLGYYGNDLDSENGLVEKNKWHNLTFWVDDSKKSRRIYVDGEKVAEGVSDGGYMGTKGEIIIGGWDRIDKGLDKAYQVYMGAVDEVRVWNRTLEENEILESMKTEMPINAKGKVTTLWSRIKKGGHIF